MIVGGGPVAERKVRGVLSAGARVRVVSPEVTPGLQALADRHVIDWRRKAYSSADLDDAVLVFAATSNPAVQEAILGDAHAAGLLVNAADAPGECDFQVPATIRRGDLTVTVATNGKSPAVAAMVRQRLEREFGDEYRLLTLLAGKLREQVLAQKDETEEPRALFQKILIDDMIEWLRLQQWEKVQRHLESVLGRPAGIDVESLCKEAP